MSWRAWATGGCLVVAITLSGCARDALHARWDARALEVEQVFSQGDYQEAVTGFRELRDDAPNSEDRFFVELRIGDCLLHLGDLGGALTTYYEANRFAGSRADVAKAMFRSARALYDFGSDRSTGIAAFVGVMERYPNTFAAQRSLDYITAHYDERPEGMKWLLAFYSKEIRRLAGTKAVGFLRYHLAEHLERVGGDRALGLALSTYDAILASSHSEALWDDALYAKALVLEKLERYDEELRVLRRILRARSKSSFFGNSETTYYHRSQWRIAQILLGPMDRKEDGLDALRTFVAEFYFSRNYDDALYLIAVILLDQGEEGEARDILTRLVRERPESRYVRRIEALLATGHDPRAGSLLHDEEGIR